MKLRSYHTETVEAAIRMAAIELGDEAIFLGSKKAPDDGSYEVTFAVVEEQTKSDQPTSPSAPAGAAAQANDPGLKARQGPVAARPDQGPIHWRQFVPVLEDTPPQPDAAVSAVPDSSTAAAARQVASPGGIAEAKTFGLPAEQRPTPAPGGSPVDDFGRQPVVSQLSDRESRLAGSQLRRLPSAQERFQREERLVESMAELTRSLRDIQEWLLRQRGVNDRWLLADQLPVEHELLDDPLCAAIYTRLMQQGVEDQLAAQILRGIASRDEQRPGVDEGEAVLEERLGFLCEKAGAPGKRGTDVDIVALVGPAESGKTSALAKLAIRYGLSRGIKVHFVGADPLRVGIAESLEAYARLLDAPLTQVTDCEKLRAAVGHIADAHGADSPVLILIDTPGYGVADWPSAERLAGALLETPQIDTHLAVSFATKPLDLRRMIERYRIFRPRKLLFTKLDETETYGSAVNEAARTKLPLSFFASGPSVPEDLLEVTPSLLARLLWRRGGSVAA
ncbi:MAG: hypothetical protein O2968_02570 [Acidobacteria bacterium]|nr:hypothetical protein [Acidobacteriota bacterium]